MFHVLFFKKYINRVLLNSVFLFLYLSSFCSATSVSNYGQWQNFNSISKTAYTAGVIDTFVKPLEMSIEHEEFVRKLDLCLKDFNISIVEVVRMIDNFYSNAENWGLSPQDAIKFQLFNGHCFQYLKFHRQSYQKLKSLRVNLAFGNMKIN